MFVMPQPLVSDFQSYYEMARSFAAGGPMRDMYGSRAFYSPGYPLLIGTVFAVVGPSVETALTVNLCLAALTGWLMFRLASALTSDTIIPLASVTIYAVWLPSVIATASVAKENLSVPLLLGFLLALINVAKANRTTLASVIAGFCFGGGLLAGASSLLVIAAFLFAALALARNIGIKYAANAVAAFSLATALILGPWLLHTSQLFGKPLLTTNSGFNLYIGNNPVATGSFLSIADTPVGPKWHDMRAQLGEAGSTDELRAMATDYALANPTRTAELAVTKLTRFWMPHIPSAVEGRGKAEVVGRWLNAAQHMLLLIFGIVGAWMLRLHPQFMPVVLTIVSFWIIHAAGVIMYRYRDPIMPLIIIFASIGFTALLRRKSVKNVRMA